MCQRLNEDTPSRRDSREQPAAPRYARSPTEGDGQMGVRQEDGRRSAVALGWARCRLSQSAFKIGDLWGVTHFMIFKKTLALMWSH